MTHEEQYELDKRMQRIEKDIAEIKAALLGNVVDGSPGLVGRVREREQVAERHELRLVKLETQAINYATQKDREILVNGMKEMEQRIEELEKVKERMVGALLLASALGAAGGGALVKILGG